MPRLQIVPPSTRGITPPEIQSQTPGADQFGAGIGRALVDASGVFAHIQEGADAAESTKLVGQGTAALRDTLADASMKYEDPEQFNQAATDALKNTYDSVLDQASSPRVRRQVEAQLANNQIEAQTAQKYKYFEKKKLRAEGDFAVASDTLSKAAASAPDDITRESHYRSFANLVGQFSAAGYLNGKQKQQAMLDFDKQVLGKQATTQILSNPAGFLAEVTPKEGEPPSKFYRLGEDKVLELSEKARRQIREEEVRQDRIGKQIKDRVEQAWFSALGQGQLSDNDINAAIRNENPWITPQQGLQFQKHKAEGTSGDKAPVTAIMSDYYRYDRSVANVNKTRQRLIQLQQTGGPNEFINKALNELQTDVSTLTSQGIMLQGVEVQRQNREITNLQTEYEAGKEVLPKQFQALTGNTDAQDRAKIKNTYLKNGPEAARELTKNLTKQKENQTKAIPPKTKAVLDAPE